MKQYMIYEAALASKPEIVNRDGEVLTFIATLQEFGAKNRNSRIYPLELGKAMIQAPQVLEKLRSRQLFVEDQHPLNAQIQRQMRIEPSNAVAIITEMWFEGNLLKGKLETTANTKGRDFRDMILFNGIIPAFSLRANGATKKDATGTIIVQEPIQMVTYDYVVTPSHIPAVMEKISGVEDRSERLHSVLFDGRSVMHETMLTESAGQSELSMLMESAEVIFDEGLMTPIEKPVRDVRKGSTQIKKLSESYVHHYGDKIKETIAGGVLVESANGDLTQMFTEEFVVKDIRSKILSETILTEKVNTEKFLERIGVRAANKYGPGGNVWAAVFAKSVTGKDSTAKPKNGVQKKFYEELLKAVNKDSYIQKKIGALKKAAEADDYDKESVRDLKKDVKSAILQLAKDLRVNQKTALNEAADGDYTSFLTELNEGFIIEDNISLNDVDQETNEVLNEGCYEIWRPMKAYMGMEEVQPRKRLSEGVTEIAAIPNAGADNPTPVDIKSKFGENLEEGLFGKKTKAPIETEEEQAKREAEEKAKEEQAKKDKEAEEKKKDDEANKLIDDMHKNGLNPSPVEWRRK